jgi:hypothetical protein
MAAQLPEPQTEEVLDTDVVDRPDVDLAERPNAGESYEKIFQRRLSRRNFMQRSAGAAAAAAATPLLTSNAQAGWWKQDDSRWNRWDRWKNADSLTFEPIEGSEADAVIVPPGYEQDVIIRWGDSLDPRYPDLDTDKIEHDELLKPGAGEAQAHQFGYNCDAVEFFPRIPRSKISSTGFVCCNHEYTQPEMKYPGWPLAGDTVLDPDSNEIRPVEPGDIARYVKDNPQIVDVELAAHGISVVQVRRRGGRWGYRRKSRFNRRITGMTPIKITGPAAGHPLLKTSADPTGRWVLGTLNNCAGGQTPWGTYLSAEENVDQYFGNFDAYAANGADPDVLDAHKRLPLPGGISNRGWEFAEDRFDVAKEPTEALRFGYVVEVDPYNPHAPAKKRTACGRFKHECATTILSKDNKCVVYSGDDARDEYMYKFVSKESYKPWAPRRKAMDLLDEGTLYAARVNDDGTGEWLPLVWKPGNVLDKAGFNSQAEVLIKARKAADALGATPMDRPEDFEANPVTKKVYCALTNNTRRQSADPNGTRTAQGREVSSFPSVPNPRGPNRFGHILEITEDNDDNAAEHFTWEIFLLAGDPATNMADYLTDINDLDIPEDSGQETTYFAGFNDPSQIAPIGSPDNVGFDNKGNLWIVTDGSQPRGTNNGGYAVPTEGPNRGKLRQFLSGPVDCEVCGCEVTPDNRTVFFNIQHPGATFAALGFPTLAEPSSYWPDSSKDSGPKRQPRPSLIAVRNGRWGIVGK